MLHSVEISSLTKRYGQLCALENVSLHFKAGKIYLLLGHNGAGKTTLMKLLLGIMKLKKSDTGRILYYGEDSLIK